MECKHEIFECHSKVGRLTDMEGEVGSFIFECKVKCTQCNQFFEFTGIPGGMNFNEPRTSFDFTELRTPIRPPTGEVHSKLNYQFENKQTKSININ